MIMKQSKCKEFGGEIINCPRWQNGCCHWCEESQTETKPMTADEIIQKLEAMGLGWDVGSAGRLIEARIWNWPYVIGRYTPGKVEPLSDMLTKACENGGIKLKESK